MCNFQIFSFIVDYKELIRKTLFKEYLGVLERYTNISEYTEEEKEKWYKVYLVYPHYEWIDVFCDEKTVGFLIVEHAPDDYPGVDYYICQAYVREEYRRRKLMTRTISTYVRIHPGTYVMCCLKDNVLAKGFWNQIFPKLGYRRVHLSVRKGRLKENEIYIAFAIR